MIRGLFDAAPFDDLMASFFGNGLAKQALPPDTVPLRILGLPGGTATAVTREQVKSAYRARVMAAHPDLQTYTHPAIRQAAEAAVIGAPDVQELTWARDTLLRKLPEQRPVTDADTGKPHHLLTFTSRNDERPPPPPRPPSRCKTCDRTWGEGARFIHSGRWRGHCTRCRHAGELKRQRDRRATARQRACEACGEPFTPPRADGRYCSPACRQKAYRARKAAVR